MVLLSLFIGVDAAILAVHEAGLTILRHAAWLEVADAEGAFNARFPDSLIFQYPFTVADSTPLAVARTLVSQAGSPVPHILVLANPLMPTSWPASGLLPAVGGGLAHHGLQLH